jgi:hypothetical protein
MKFSHIADCHLGGWRQPELQELNLESFKKAIDVSIQERVDFVLIVGDLFDSAYPSIEILGEAFSQLKRLKESRISCYIIAGSHDYSASGKTFLSVLEKAGFCKNLFKAEEKEDKILLNPVVHGNVAIYGYPGKKAGMEIEEIRKIKLQSAPGLFRICALHTCIEQAIGKIPTDYLRFSEMPEADYYALGHLHMDFEKDKKYVYGGPTFPNNFQEIAELKHGRFYIVETSPFSIKKIDLKIKDVELVEKQLYNSLTATEEIISELKNRILKDKIVLLKLYGKLKQGKTSNINFKEIEEFVKSRQGYCLLKNTSKLSVEQTEIKIETEDMEKLEENIIENYVSEHKSRFNSFIPSLIDSLSSEKQEDEKTQIFKSRLFSDLNKVLKIELED